jgi:hypothetical protein
MDLPSGALLPLELDFVEFLKLGLPKLGAFGLLIAPIELCRNDGEGSPAGVKDPAVEGGGGPAGVVEGWSIM